MSYIQDALKKSRREKDILSGNHIEGHTRVRIGGMSSMRRWLIPTGLFVVAFVFSLSTWRHVFLNPTYTSSQPLTSPDGTGMSATPPPSVNSQPKVAVATQPPRPSPMDGFSKKKTGRVVRQKQPRRHEQTPPSPQVPSRNNAKHAVTPPGNEPKSSYLQAVELQKKGRLEDAIKLYEVALEKKPNMVSALNNMGTVYLQQRNFEKAGQVLEKAVRIDPAYADAYYNLACLHAQKREISRGIYYLKKSIDIDPNAREWAKRDKDLQVLRNHSEYEKIF